MRGASSFPVKIASRAVFCRYSVLLLRNRFPISIYSIAFRLLINTRSGTSTAESGFAQWGFTFPFGISRHDSFLCNTLDRDDSLSARWARSSRDYEALKNASNKTRVRTKGVWRFMEGFWGLESCIHNNVQFQKMPPAKWASEHLGICTIYDGRHHWFSILFKLLPIS